jgi:hypothetical protein
MDSSANAIQSYLPVYIPVLLVIMSVLVGIAHKRITLNLSGLLKCHSDVALGLFSFVIWALVAYNQSGQNLSALSRQIIQLSEHIELNYIWVMFLLFVDVFLLLGGVIIQLIIREPLHKSATRVIFE